MISGPGKQRLQPPNDLSYGHQAGPTLEMPQDTYNLWQYLSFLYSPGHAPSLS